MVKAMARKAVDIRELRKDDPFRCSGAPEGQQESTLCLPPHTEKAPRPG